MGVIKLAVTVLRSNMRLITQASNETAREYYANIRSASESCEYEVECPHPCCTGKPKIGYAADEIKHQFVSGLADQDIKRDILGLADLDKKTDKELLKVVEEKELARNAMNHSSTANVAGVSAYHKTKSQPAAKDPHSTDVDSKLNKTSKCRCGDSFKLFKRYSSGKTNKDAFKLCQKCYRKEKRTSGKQAAAIEDDVPTNLFIGAITDIDCIASDE